MDYNICNRVNWPWRINAFRREKRKGIGIRIGNFSCAWIAFVSFFSCVISFCSRVKPDSGGVLPWRRRFWTARERWRCFSSAYSSIPSLSLSSSMASLSLSSPSPPSPSKSLSTLPMPLLFSAPGTFLSPILLSLSPCLFIHRLINSLFRPGASSGILLGAVTLPSLLLSKLVQLSRGFSLAQLQIQGFHSNSLPVACLFLSLLGRSCNLQFRDV